MKDGSEYQQNNFFEWYKLSILEVQDKGLVICEGLLDVDILHWDAQRYERRSMGGTSSPSLWVYPPMVDDNVLNHIIDETHARTLWQKLEELYALKEGTNKMFLIKKLMCLR